VGLIYLDSCVLIYLVEHRSKLGDDVRQAMRKAPQALFCVSPLVKLECMVGPIKSADPVLQRAYMNTFENFETLSMPEQVYLQAAQLRARFGLRTSDALHLACAQHHRCEALWTNDNRLAKASHGLARKLPS
jgi:predicted nucleic acid-binding protein